MRKIDYRILNFLQESPFPFGVTRELIIQSVKNDEGKSYARTTIFDALTRLLILGMVVRKTRRLGKKRGRPKAYWSANI